VPVRRERIRDLPLGDKLVVVGVASSALALIAASLIFLLSNLLAVRANIRNELRVQGAIIAENTAPSLMFRNNATAAETLGALRVTGVDVACLYDADGALFASHVSPGVAADCPAAPPPERGGWLRDLDARLPVVFRGRQHGSLYLRSTFSDFWSRMGDQLVAALAGIGLGVVIAVLLSRWVQRLISEPVVELSETAGRIARAGDYSLRAAKTGNDEIGQLVDTFNLMVSEVERRDEQLRAASRLKDEFLAALSHELRTPLNAVLGWIQVLRTTPADPVTTARAYESIERNARAQASLIEDLLDISRIVSGKLHVRSEPVDLVGVIAAALEVVRPTAEAKQIALTRRLLPAPQTVIGDGRRLQQIAWNLLSNAVKFTARGGRVLVTLRADGGSYVLEVQDDGIGIAPAFLPFVFERFRQADGSITRRHGGLGLGLAIARELTELHGGTIRATSDGEQRGATFSVTLPQSPPRGVDAPPAPHGDAAFLQGLSVLVVDDDRDAKEMATALLSAGGARVRTASSAEGALRAIASEPFDVLLCDLAMPGTDGYELMQRIRAGAGRPGQRTPAVAVSAAAGRAVEARARRSGYDGFVSKPFSIDELIAAIRLAIGRGV
jgi:signal transduction histidine kinase/ActR/RegA family two-component response regulator